MPLKEFKLTKTFDRERCDCCGVCLEQCPVLRLPLHEAQREILLLEELGNSAVLERCTGCMACNSLCPTDANPHTLIMERWRQRYAEEGLPARVRLVLPQQESNLYQVTIELLPEDERALVEQWERNRREPPSDCMLYAGCNILMMPYLMDSPLFKEIAIFGSPHLCCGEPLYRMGCWDAAKKAAENVCGEFQRMKLKQVIMPCLAGFHLFSRVYRDVFDIDVGVDLISIEDWLEDCIQAGKISITPLRKTAVIHDNCWPKASGDYFFDKTRHLLDLLGITVIEPEHTRETALCCGMCAAAANYSIMDVFHAARRRLKELEDARADMIIDYCGGCHWLLSLTEHFMPLTRSVPIYHLIEAVQMAAGEPPKLRAHQRTAEMVKAMAPALVESYLSPGRFWV